MSTPAFTPGPWQVAGVRHSGDLKIGPSARLHFVGPDDDAVAAVFFDMKTGKGFADAHLIAAAPELGEALERAFVFICHNCPLGPTNDRTAAGKLIDELRIPLSKYSDAKYGEEQSA